MSPRERNFRVKAFGKGKSKMKEYKVKVYSDKTEWYNLNDQLHREDGPAIEWANGDKYWYLNDKLHREDGPAVECANGNKYWYLNGQYLTEKEHKEKTKKEESCEGKVVEIDGKKYKLMSV